jgi:hypothetical protein
VEPSRRVWIRVLTALALPLIVVLAVALGVLVAAVFYLRALALALAHPFRRRRDESPGLASPLAGPHTAPAPQFLPSDPGASAR